MLALFVLAPVSASFAQTNIRPDAAPRTRASLRQALLDASVDTRVVVVATHPDDEYRGLCLLLRRKWGCDVTVVVATRGEGGQNAIGPELGEDLGRIRTIEAVTAAQRVLDVKLRFLDLPDFGYCRTAAEALDRWRGKVSPYERIRRTLSELEPDLLITPHSPAEAHGQKRAVLHLLRRFMTEMRGSGPRFFRGAVLGEEAAHVVLDLDQADSELPGTFREEAFRALRFHRTQRPHRPFEAAIPAEIGLVCESRSSSSLLAGLPSLWDHASTLGSWLGAVGEATSVSELRRLLEALPQIPKSRRLLQDYDPTTLAIDLLNVLQKLRVRATEGSDLSRRLGRRLGALQRAILTGSVVRLRWNGDGNDMLDGPRARISAPLRIWNGGPRDVAVRVQGLSGPSAPWLELLDPAGRAFDPSARIEVARERHGTLGLVLADNGRGPPGTRLEVALELEVSIGDACKFAARLARQVEYVPPLTIRPVPQSRFLVAQDGGLIRLSLVFAKPLGTRLEAVLARAAPLGISLLPESDLEALPIAVTLPPNSRERRLAIRLRVAPWVTNGTQRARSRLATFYLKNHAAGPKPPPARCEVRIDPVRIRLPEGLRIGIVRGPDDTVEQALRSLGFDVVRLEPDALASADLDDFGTILIDSRALLRRARDLKPQVHRFVSYAKRGHHLVVLYHKAQEFNEMETGVRLAPFPLELGSNRVTREDAPVRVLRPDHWLVSRPNELEPRDWDGWEQERGLYFPEHGAYDPRYDEVIAIQEPTMRELQSVQAEPDVLEFEPQRGALLAAEVGSGSYVYCALAIHRQLRVFHPGAARLLVNLVTPAGWTRFR